MHIPFWLHFYLGSFSYTSQACFNFLWGISYTSHVGFKKNIILGSFSYTSHAGFIFMRGVSQTHPVLALFLSGEFLLHIPFLLYFFGWAGWVGRSSYTGEFLLHIPCWGCLFFVCLFLNLGSFSYRSRAGFVFMRGVSLTHPVLAFFFFLSRVFLLHIPCLPMLAFCVGSFSYTSHTEC